MAVTLNRSINGGGGGGGVQSNTVILQAGGRVTGKQECIKACSESITQVAEWSVFAKLQKYLLGRCCMSDDFFFGGGCHNSDLALVFFFLLDQQFHIRIVVPSVVLINTTDQGGHAW